MGAMTRSAQLALAAVAIVVVWSASAAQSPSSAAAAAANRSSPDACSLLTDAEVEKLVVRGRPTYGIKQRGEAVRLADGSACEYPIGAQVVLFSGPKSQTDFEAFLRNFKKDKERRHPVSGVGDRAYIMFPTPRDEYEDRLAYLVTSVGQHTVAVSMAAKKGAAEGPMMEYCRRGQLSKKECAEIEAAKGETAESLQPAVVEVAKAVVAKLRSGS